MAASGRVGFSAQEMSNLLRADEEEDSHRQVEMREAALDSAYNAISQATGAPIGDPTDLINTHDNNGPIRSIWGSSVQVSTLAMKTYQFIRHFKKPVADGTMEAYYPKLLDQVCVLMIVLNFFKIMDKISFPFLLQEDDKLFSRFFQ